MNRYTALGLTADATEGKHILVLTRTTNEIREAVAEIARVALNAHVERTHGRELVTFPRGGEIRVRSHGASLRGHSADVVYLDAGVGQDINLDTLSDCHLIVAASPSGEIIRA